MARQARKQSETGYFHVIVRGNGKQILFEESSDYRYYLSLLERYSEETTVAVCAYCLMENHVHLLLQDKESDLSLFMKKLGVSYSAYFNKKYERTGHLFQDRFLSEAVDDDPYFLTVYRYIIKNPQSAGICSFNKYEWSSFSAYGAKDSFVDTSLISSMLGDPEHHFSFLSEETEESCMEYDVSRMSDEKAVLLIRNKLGVSSGAALQQFDRKERDAAIVKLNRLGISERQLERLTGISRRIIHDILW